MQLHFKLRDASSTQQHLAIVKLLACYKNIIYQYILTLIACVIVSCASLIVNAENFDKNKNATPVSLNLWQIVGSELGQHDEFLIPASHKAIAQEIKWLERNHRYLYNVTRRSDPYAYYIVQQCLERGLPLELALLPMVESAYDVYAYSPGRATGLWQFIPATGKHYGLEQNWWYDGRRDPVASTDAALTYLSELYNRFDDWLLALAAYNAGPARVGRAIKKNNKAGLPVDYWSLKLPKETQHYVPRLLAIRDMIMNPEQHGVEFFPVANSSFFSSVDINSQIDLAQAAKMADVDMDQLYRLNPGLSRWATPPEGPHRLLLPTAHADVFRQALSATDVKDRLRWDRYTVSNGDSLSRIAHRFGTRQKLIMDANGLSSSSIRIGQALLIPVASEQGSHYVLSQERRDLARGKSKPGKAKLTYTVKSGDSWWDIGRKFGVSSATLAKWNGKAKGDLIRPGQKLVVWKKLASASEKGIFRSFIYKVKSGDSLSRIATRYKVSVSQLVNWNDISSSRYLQPGQKIKIKVNVKGGV